MGLFSFFQRKPTDSSMRAGLVQLVLEHTTVGGRVRCEDAICAAAAIVGERCIDVAGDYSVRDHDMPRGQGAFSTRVNELLCGDEPDVEKLPAESVYGILKAGLNSDAMRKWQGGAQPTLDRQ